MTYRTNDNKHITGDTPAAVVDALRAHAWMTEASAADYMHAVAERVKLWNGSDIRDDSAVNFLNDLTACDLLTKQS